MSSPRACPALLALAAALAALLVAACGTAAATTRPRPRLSTPVTVRGALIRVRGTTLTVQRDGERGSVRVTFAPRTTPIYAVTTATSAVIQPGSCIVASGDRDGTGTLTADVIVAASSVDDTCPPGSVPAPPSAPDPSPSPSPGSFPLPSPAPSPDVLSGQVLSVGADAIVVEGPEGNPAVVLLPHDDRVLFFQPADRSSLVIPSCVVIPGIRRARTVAARQITDWPTGTGC